MEEQFLSLVSGRSGHFELESGHHGDLWFQLETLCQHSRQIQPFARQLADKLMTYQVEVICGPLIEGAFIALLVSLEIGRDFLYAERFPNTERQGLYSRVPPSGSATIRREGQARRHRERLDQRRIGGHRNIYRFAIDWRQRRCHRSASRLGRYNSRVRRRQVSSSRTSEAYAQQFVGAFPMSALRRRATARNCRHILKEYAR
jgi:hypothetical protein